MFQSLRSLLENDRIVKKIFLLSSNEMMNIELAEKFNNLVFGELVKRVDVVCKGGSEHKRSWRYMEELLN